MIVTGSFAEPQPSYASSFKQYYTFTTKWFMKKMSAYYTVSYGMEHKKVVYTFI